MCSDSIIQDEESDALRSQNSFRWLIGKLVIGLKSTRIELIFFQIFTANHSRVCVNNWIKSISILDFKDFCYSGQMESLLPTYWLTKINHFL